MKPFLIISLPRSMTAWAANWFTVPGKSFCEHEGMQRFRKIDHFIKMNIDNPGIVHGDSNSALPLYAHDDITNLSHHFNIGYINREKDDALESYRKATLGIEDDPDYSINAADLILKKVLNNIEFMEIKFSDMTNEDAFRAFHEYLTPSVQFDRLRFNLLKDLRVLQKTHELYKRENV